MVPAITGKRLSLIMAQASDAAPLANLLTDPDVAHWWHGYDTERLLGEIADPAYETYVIQCADRCVGMLVVVEDNEPNSRCAAIHLFIGRPFHGKGLGAEAMRVAVHELFEHRAHHRVVIDPRATNERVIHMCRKVGFRPVGVLRQHERDAAGKWHDALLMDLLRGDWAAGQ